MAKFECFREKQQHFSLPHPPAPVCFLQSATLYCCTCDTYMEIRVRQLASDHMGNDETVSVNNK